MPFRTHSLSTLVSLLALLACAGESNADGPTGGNDTPLDGTTATGDGPATSSSTNAGATATNPAIGGGQSMGGMASGAVTSNAAASEAGGQSSGGAATTVSISTGGTSEPTMSSSGGASAGSVGSGGTAVVATAGTGGTGGASMMDEDPLMPEGWFDPAWTQRLKVTVTDAELTEEVAEFQIPVPLNAQDFDYAGAESTGADLRFVTSDGVVLKHEIETWDPEGESLIWLLLPTLSATPVELWLYYGNPAADTLSEEERRAVWPEPYTAVWHLGGDTTDSSLDPYDGTNMGGTFTDGVFGQGVHLSRPDQQYVVISPDTPIPLVSAASGSTFSAWILPETIDGAPGDASDAQDNGSVVLTIGGGGTRGHNSYTGFNVNYDGRMITHVDPSDQGGYKRVRSDSGVVQMEEWTWVTYVVDLPAGEVHFYKNGQQMGTVSEGAFNGSTYSAVESSRVVIGTEEDFTKHFWDGALDELRIETGMRTAGWIAAQYRAMTTQGYVTVTAD